MKKDGCAACHAIDKKVVGPAYNDVAAKYKGDAGRRGEAVEEGQGGRLGRLGPDADAAERGDARMPTSRNWSTWILDAQEVGALQATPAPFRRAAAGALAVAFAPSVQESARGR